MGDEGDKHVVDKLFNDSFCSMPELNDMRVSESGSTVSRVGLIHGMCDGFEIMHDLTGSRVSDIGRAARSVVAGKRHSFLILLGRSVRAEVIGEVCTGVASGCN